MKAINNYKIVKREGKLGLYHEQKGKNYTSISFTPFSYPFKRAVKMALFNLKKFELTILGLPFELCVWCGEAFATTKCYDPNYFEGKPLEEHPITPCCDNCFFYLPTIKAESEENEH